MTINVQFDLSKQTARLDQTIGLPGEFTATYDAAGLPLVEVDVVVVDGVPVCDGVRLKRREGAASLEGTELSRVSIADIIELASRRIGWVLVDSRPGTPDLLGRPTRITQWRGASQEGEEGQRVRRAVTKARQRRRLTDGLLRDVARVYRANPDRPTKSVAEAFHVSAAQASRYVKEARERGQLEKRGS